MAVCTTTSLAPNSCHSLSGCGASRFLSNAGDMLLKVSGFGKEARLVQIRSAKCTIGSAAGCTLRVRGGGVGPLACWILRGLGGTVVRRLHGAATLNGGQFEEAALRNGDQLRIGGVKLEVVECNQPSQQPAALFSAPLPNETVAALEAKLADAMSKMQRLEAESRQGFQSSIVAANRADQLRDALADAHEQLEDTCRDLTAAQQSIAAQQETIATQIDTIEAQKCEIEAIRIEAIKSGEVKSTALVEEARRETAAAVKQCAATGAELAQVRSEAARDHSQWEEERKQYELRLEQRAAEIEALRNAPTGQAGAMTVAFGRDGKPTGEQGILEAQIKTLEEQIAAKDREIESLRQVEAGQFAVKGELELLQSEYACKCNELKAAQDRLVEAEQQLANFAGLEARTHSILEREEGLVERERSVCAAEQQSGEERAALATLREQLAADRQKLAEDLEQVAQTRQQLEQERTQSAECESKKEALDERELQLESQVADLAERVAAASAREIELDAHREQLARQQESLDQRSQCLQQQQDELDARAADLNAKAEELETLREELNANAAAIRPQHQCGEAGDANGCGTAAERTGEAPAEVESSSQSALVTMVCQSPEAMQQECLEINVADAESTQGSGEDVRESASVDVVLSRLVKAGLWRGNEEAIAGSGASVEGEEGPISQTMIVSEPIAEPAASMADQDVVQVPRSAELTRPTPTHGDEEESIESYMDRLMQRVRGDSQPVGNKPNPISKASVESTPSSVAAPVPAAPEQPAESNEAAEYSPRRTAPELPNMSAMRDLANTAARSAIDEHVRTHTGKQATGKLLGACLTICCCLVLGYWAWYAWSLPATVGAAIGGGIGLYWTWAAIRRLFTLMRLNRPQESPAATVNSADQNSILVETTP